MVAASLAAVSALGAGAAFANVDASATIYVSSSASTQRAVRVGGPLGLTVEVDKVSDPTLLLKATSSTVAPTLRETKYGAGQNNCAAADDPANGYFNRKITVKVAAGTTADIYTKATYKTTDPAGTETNHSLSASAKLIAGPLSSAEYKLLDLCVS
jgi:hypothetical protein